MHSNFFIFFIILETVILQELEDSFDFFLPEINNETPKFKIKTKIFTEWIEKVKSMLSKRKEYQIKLDQLKEEIVTFVRYVGVLNDLNKGQNKLNLCLKDKGSCSSQRGLEESHNIASNKPVELSEDSNCSTYASAYDFPDYSDLTEQLKDLENEIETETREQQRNCDINEGENSNDLCNDLEKINTFARRISIKEHFVKDIEIYRTIINNYQKYYKMLENFPKIIKYTFVGFEYTPGNKILIKTYYPKKDENYESCVLFVKNSLKMYRKNSRRLENEYLTNGIKKLNNRFGLDKSAFYKFFTIGMFNGRNHANESLKKKISNLRKQLCEVKGTKLDPYHKREKSKTKGNAFDYQKKLQKLTSEYSKIIFSPVNLFQEETLFEIDIDILSNVWKKYFRKYKKFKGMRLFIHVFKTLLKIISENFSEGIEKKVEKSEIVFFIYENSIFIKKMEVNVNNETKLDVKIEFEFINYLDFPFFVNTETKQMYRSKYPFIMPLLVQFLLTLDQRNLR